MSEASWAVPRRLIYVDTAYTLRMIRQKRHEDYWLARHNAGYFERVWGVHPMVDVADGPDLPVRAVERFSAKQISIQGRSRPLALPKWLLPIDFLWSQIGLFRALVRHARRWPVAAVFANDPLYCGLFASMVARALKVPLVVFIPAEYDEMWNQGRVLGSPRLLRFRKVEQAVMRLVFARSEMVIAVAKSVDGLARRYGARAETIANLTHGKYLSTRHLQPPDQRPDPAEVRRRHGIPEAASYLIYVGRMVPVKHPEDALRAMAAVVKAEAGVIGIMAGEGELMPALRTQAAALGVADRVIFAGAIDQPALAALLPHCITLSPLTGMALIETALAGSPVVAYDRDWQSEFVRDGETGFVVPFLDSASMAERALQILRDPALREAMSDAQRAHGLAFVDVEGNRRKEWAAWDAMFARWNQRVG